MKIKINKNGNLSLERAGKMKAQFCPHTTTNTDERLVGCVACGDWCPLFGEPHYSQTDVRIELCDETIWSVKTSDFTDERTDNTQESGG